MTVKQWDSLTPGDVFDLGFFVGVVLATSRVGGSVTIRYVVAGSDDVTHVGKVLQVAYGYAHNVPHLGVVKGWEEKRSHRIKPRFTRMRP